MAALLSRCVWVWEMAPYCPEEDAEAQSPLGMWLMAAGVGLSLHCHTSENFMKILKSRTREGPGGLKNPPETWFRVDTQSEAQWGGSATCGYQLGGDSVPERVRSERMVGRGRQGARCHAFGGDLEGTLSEAP